MRSICRFPSEAQARIFSDFLWVQGIQNELDQDETGEWILWVHSEDQLDDAKEQLRAFLENPEAQEYARAAQEARQIKEAEKKRAAQASKRGVDIRTTWNRSMRFGVAPLTLVLIALSVVVALITRLGESEEFLHHLLITDFVITGNMVQFSPKLMEIRSGEVWRLITPIFIHFGFIHILFNMLWLKDLGTVIERLQGPWKLALLVCVIGALSNLGQFYEAGPIFGGMSGVVYGLLGYIWLRGKFDPASGFRLDRRIVLFMAGWFLVCFFLPYVANTAHGVGLGVGLAWGYLSAQWARTIRKRS